MGRAQRSATVGRLSALLVDDMASAKDIGLLQSSERRRRERGFRPFLFNFPDFSGRMAFPGRRSSLSNC